MPPGTTQLTNHYVGSGTIPCQDSGSGATTDTLGIEYLADGRARFYFQHGAEAPVTGPALAIRRDTPTWLEVATDSLTGRLANRAGRGKARVAIGFTKGHRKGDYWSITAHNAHAWTEVYFSGIGWTLWEPTPLDESTDESGTATSP